MDTVTEALKWLVDSENYSGETGIPFRIYEHLQMSIQAVLVAALIALPVGMYVGHKRRFEFLAVSVGNIGRALPSFGILGFAFVFTNNWPGTLGFWATFVTLTLLAIPPLLTNTYVGIKGVDADTIEAARGMGMTEFEILRKLEIPVSIPLIVGGARIAAVQVVATATLGALVAWGGLGRFIIDGKSQGDSAQLLGGAILVALLAVLTEVAFSVLERVVAPKGLKRRRAKWSSGGRAPAEMTSGI
jgi:osmoprotectant transport system permease protein